MNQYATLSAVNEYKDTGNSSIAYADPHGLILKLMTGAIERISQAKGAVLRQNVQMKGELIGKSIGIISGLEACLDHDKGSELSQNLAALYQYMTKRLLEANIENNTDKLDEVSRLMHEIKSGWEQIEPK